MVWASHRVALAYGLAVLQFSCSLPSQLKSVTTLFATVEFEPVIIVRLGTSVNFLVLNIRSKKKFPTSYLRISSDNQGK
jgi:hypothetical protein